MCVKKYQNLFDLTVNFERILLYAINSSLLERFLVELKPVRIKQPSELFIW